MKVFVGSSREGTEHEAFLKVCQWIESEGHEAVRWDSPGLFPLGQYTLETLLELAPTMDAALLVFSPDDISWYRGSEQSTPRDNVILEYGLFAGTLGRRRSIVFEAGETRIASDLDGITTLRFSPGRWSVMEQQLRSWLKRVLSSQSSQTATRWKPAEEDPSSPFQARGKKSLFETGTKLIGGAQRRVVLVAKTPVLLMGPRPYGAPARYVSWEQEQFDLYHEIASTAASSESISLMCLANTHAVIEELNSGPESLADSVGENLERLEELASSNLGFSFLWHDSLTSMNFVVADNDFMMWLKDATGESVWIIANNEVVSNALVAHAETIASASYRVQSRVHLQNIIGEQDTRRAE